MAESEYRRKSAADVASERSLPGPGWYQDPSGRQRWWDGSTWTDHYTPAPAAAPVADRAKTGGGGAIAGWVFAFLMPVIGFLIGIALIAQGHRDGGYITVASVIAGILYLAIFSPGTL